MRIIFNGLTAISLAVCLAACAFWWRSRSIDEFVFFPRKGHVSYSLDSREEGFHLDSIEPWPTDERPEVISYRRDRPMPDIVVMSWGAPPVVAWDQWGVAIKTGTYCLPLGLDGSVLKTLPGANAPWPYVMAPITCRFITVSQWWVAGLSGILPAVWCARYLRWRWRRVAAKGLCAQCGYDLRASTDRCPECGRPISGSAPPLSTGGKSV